MSPWFKSLCITFIICTIAIVACSCATVPDDKKITFPDVNPCIYKPCRIT